MATGKGEPDDVIPGQRRFFKWEDANWEQVTANFARHLLVGQHMTFSVDRLGPDFETAGQLHENSEEFEFIVKGNFQMRIGDEERVVGPGEVAYVPANTFHKGKALGEEVIVVHACAPPRRDFIDRSFARYLK